MEDEDDFSALGEIYYDESRLPPPESCDGEGEEDSWDYGEALIDQAAYIIDERNYTTARCPVTKRAIDGVKKDMLQATFCLAPPPRISYFCISYSSGQPARFLHEPRIVAAEGNLALIGLKHCTLAEEPSAYIYFIYRAPVLPGHGSPELRRLTHPSDEVSPDCNVCYLPRGLVGILRYRAADGDNDAYKIATLASRWISGIRHYDLCTYDSKADAWTREPTVFSQGRDTGKDSFDKVITIGGKMGWVELWRCILLCDVHVPAGQEESQGRPRLLRYIPLPKPMQPDNDLPIFGWASFFRDIAVVDGRIKFVDLQIHAMPGSRIPSGWTAVTWTMAPNDQEFHKDVELHSRDIIGPLQPSLFVAHPTLSSHDHDVLYLMTKASLDDAESHVIAVNMKTKKLERVAKFTTQREASMDHAYMRTAISNYPTPGPGDPKGNNMKRRGPVLRESSSKKPRAINNLVSSSGYDDDQMEGAGDDRDNMDID